MDPWSHYWQADNLHSCIPSAAESYSTEIAAYWVRFGRSLAKGARVIDLATGNGAVPATLVKAGLELDITGVDKAAIDPPRYLTVPDAVRGVRFIGGVDLSAPDNLPGSFDALTSQFGLEYLPAAARAPLVARALDRGGRFQVLIHHADSEVVGPRRRDLAELNTLLANDGLMPALLAFARGRDNAGDLERLGRQHLAQSSTMTRRLSGQVLAALDRILTAYETRQSHSRQLAVDLHTRVTAEAERLRQLVDAALDEAGVHDLCSSLHSAGLQVADCRPMRISSSDSPPVIIGWHVAGRN